MKTFLIGGKGYGKTAFSDMVINSVSDGDLSVRLDDVEYSTNSRKIITVDDMIKHAIRNGEFQ